MFSALPFPPPQDSAPVAVQVGQVTAVARRPQVQLALELAEMADQPAAWPGMGVRTAGPLRLVVVPDARALAAATSGRAPTWGAGLAFPGSRTIMLRADLPNLKQTLRHELAHLALHQAIRPRVPLWFDEGYASLAAGEWDRLDAFRLSWLVLRGQIPDFREVDGALRGGADAADQAYTLSMSAVVELGRLNPAGSLDSLLSRLERGTSFDSSVAATTGRTVGQFENDWRRSVRQRYNIFVWFGAGGFWVVIAFSLGVLLGYRRRRDRPRRLALNEGWTLPAEVDEPTSPTQDTPTPPTGDAEGA